MSLSIKILIVAIYIYWLSSFLSARNSLYEAGIQTVKIKKFASQVFLLSITCTNCKIFPSRKKQIVRQRDIANAFGMLSASLANRLANCQVIISHILSS